MAEESTRPPKVFLSYAWEDDVKRWVRVFAKQLRKDGVETVLDQWETHYGDQLPQFMEKAVRESDFVIIICTPKYKKKSDDREGGVGYEGHIITSEIFQNSNHRKFIPVLRKGTWGSALPSWAAGKLSMDLRGDPFSKENYQDLLRTLHGKRYVPPPIGRPPDFSDDEIDDIPAKPHSKPPRKPLLSRDYFDKFIALLIEFIRRLFPLIRIIGILVIIGGILWAGSWAIPKFALLVPSPRTTTTRLPVVKVTLTNPPVIPTQTLKPNVAPTKTRTPTPVSSLKEITDAKGVSMRLIPSGTFTMGIDSSSIPDYLINECRKLTNSCDQNISNETPSHVVNLTDFYIDKYEVTNGLYKACVNAGVCKLPIYTNSVTYNTYYLDSEFDNYPVINVDWNMSKTYCEWRGNGTRLPTEAEWEKAARGNNGSLYPWGEKLDKTFANYAGTDVTAVGSYESGKSTYDVYDMVGNVSEWTSSLLMPYPYKASDGRENLNSSDARVIRGGSWDDTNRFFMLVTNRFALFPNRFTANIGFRCAKDATP